MPATSPIGRRGLCPGGHDEPDRHEKPGGAKLSKIQRRDVQRLADELLVSGADPSTIRNALKPLQVIYRCAIEDGDLALNPCDRLRLPTARGRR